MENTTGEHMQKNCEQMGGSIDKVLDYIEADIENPEKKEDLGDLIDVHTLLTQLKVNHIERNKTPDTKPDDLFLYSYLVINSFNVIFGNWESHTHIDDERVLLYNDLVYLDINRDEGVTQCIISFYHMANPVIVAEAINILKDLFGVGLKISSDCFKINDATNEYIWGEENIRQHIKGIRGNRIKPIMYFDDGVVGNS